jgi:predicted acetyltransferase
VVDGASEDDDVTLRLRPPRIGDETAVLTSQRELAADDFMFAFLRPGQSFAEFVQMVEDHRHGRAIDDDWVESTWLLADVDGAVVGRSSVRFELNDYLLAQGGHIGYAVRPGHRRRGYATEILRQSLVLARAGGVHDVLVTCDHHNVGSVKAIEANGGVLENVVDVDGVPLRRYWID